MRTLAVAYVPFYLVDWRLISLSAVAASTHLVLFIAAYQPMESSQRDNQAQRLLTAGLIFTASVATATHLTIVFFVIAFALLMLRQLIYISHIETVRSLELSHAEPPAVRTAGFYLSGAVVIGALLFPLLPRVRNPFVQGMVGLPGASTGLSETIDFSEARNASPGDDTVVARVWIDIQSRPFFTPVRLRGNIYDRFARGQWVQTYRGLRGLEQRDGGYELARPEGVTRKAIVQQRPNRGKLFLPVGSYAVSGVSGLFEGPARETYYTYDRGMLSLEVSMAYSAEPLQLVRTGMSGYSITPEVEALAERIVGNEQRPERKAARIESYLLSNYRYLPNDATANDRVSLDQFLLVTRAGHCEYFAAAMVVLLNAVEVPARIAGGFYGGRFNPLTGYYALRREDAHAWTEVWDGRRWLTFDATPYGLRPGTGASSTLRMYVGALADSVTYFWDRYILTFGLSDQITLTADLITWGRRTAASLRSMFASNTRELASPRFALVLGMVLAAGAAAILLARRRRRPFDLLERFLRERGIEVGEAMTMEEALGRLDGEAAREIAPLVALYEEEEFSGRRDPERLRLIRRRLAELR
jgi:transglutaminase-like putative cysteine protease